MPISSQRQFLVTVAGVDGFFATCTGGNTRSQVTREHDGGKLDPEVLAEPRMHEDLTVRRPYKPERDAAVLARLRAMASRWRTTVSKQPTDADLVAVGAPTVYSVLLIGVNDPDADAGSGDAARLELVFAVESVR